MLLFRPILQMRKLRPMELNPLAQITQLFNERQPGFQPWCQMNLPSEDVLLPDLLPVVSGTPDILDEGKV